MAAVIAPSITGGRVLDRTGVRHHVCADGAVPVPERAAGRNRAQLLRRSTAPTHGCLVDTDDVDRLYVLFTEGLHRAFGSLPVQGIPRIGALADMSYGVRQFLVIDPGGNTIQIA